MTTITWLRRLIITVCAGLLTSGAARAGSVAPAVVAIKAGHIILPDSERILDNQIIIVEDGRIVKIGSDIDVSHIAHLIDLSDSWVMAGMIDCHVHLTRRDDYGAPSNEKTFTTQPASYRALIGAVNAKQFLVAGFTTVKEIGNDGNWIGAGLVRAINERLIQGPTIVYTGKIIGPFGGQAPGETPEVEGLWHIEYPDADSQDEIRKAIRRNLYFGATAIKLFSGDDGFFDQASWVLTHGNAATPTNGAFSPYYSEDDIRAAVQEAAKYNAKVTVHTMGGIAARNVILGGAAGIEHGFALNDELLGLMKKKGVFLCGTELSRENFLAYGFPEAVAAGYAQKAVGRLRRAYDIGVKLAFGTDVIIDLPGKTRVQSSHEVLKAWTAAGIPPIKILKAMTSSAAELLGVDRDRGALEPGLFADIVGFQSNPLDDIDNVQSVRFVMKEGVVIEGPGADLPAR